MSSVVSGPPDLKAVLANKEAAELGKDVEAVLATFHGEPVFEFLPAGQRLVGRDAVAAFYKQMVVGFLPRVMGYKARETFWSDSGMAMEEEITVRLDDGEVRTFVLVVVTGLRDGLLWGERLYGDEEFFRLLLGELFEPARETGA